MIELTTPCPGWTSVREDGIELFISPDGVRYTRARSDETPAIVIQMRTCGVPPLMLVRADGSSTVRRVERKLKRERRERKARGYGA